MWYVERRKAGEEEQGNRIGIYQYLEILLHKSEVKTSGSTRDRLGAGQVTSSRHTIINAL